MIIIVEGIDRIGKTTLCNKLAERLNGTIRKYKCLDDMPNKPSKEELTDEEYNGQLILLIIEKLKEETGLSIIDRFHFTERAYGEAYRGYKSKYYNEINQKLENRKDVLLILVNPNHLEESNRQHGKDQTECCMIMNQLYGAYNGYKLNCNYDTIDETVEKAKEWVEDNV